MSEWKECRFSDLLQEKVRNGIYKKREFHGSGCCIVNMGELFKYPRLSDISMKRVELSEIEKEKFLLAEGDLIFARRSLTEEGAGKCSLIKKLSEETTFESSIIRARPNGKMVDSDFLFYYFNAPFGKYQLGTILRQVAVAGITGSDLMELMINTPPLPEQKAIAAVLSSLDDKIDLLNRQNKTLEAMAETLFREYFPPTHELRRAGIEEADGEWKEGKLYDEFDFVMGSSPPGESYNEDGIGIPMYQGNADFGFRFPKRRVFTTDPKRLAEKYDTLISVRAPVGEQNMAIEKCCIGRGVATFKYKAKPSFYTYTYFKMKSLMEEIKQFNETGTVFGSISKTDFENIDTLIPTLDIVEQFQAEVKPIDDKVITNCKQIQTLEKLRDTLLPKLMSGEVRVRM